MSESLGRSVLELDTDDTALQKGMDSAEKTTQSRMGRMGGLVKKGALAGGAALAGMGAAATAAAFKTADYGDQLDKTSQKLGVHTDFLQDADFWASQNGLSASSMERAVGRLNQRVGRAVEGNEKYQQAFEKLDISLEDSQGNIRATEDVMRDTIDALTAVEDPALKSALAAEVFGTKLSRDLQPALQDGSLTFEQATAEMENMGRMTEDQIAIAAEFSDAWDMIQRTVAKFLREAAVPVMEFFVDRLFPALQTVVSGISSVVTAFTRGGLEAAIIALRDNFGSVFENLLDGVGNLISQIFEWLSERLPEIIGFLLEQRAVFFEAALTVFRSLVDALPEIIPQVLDAVLTMVRQLIGALLDTAPLVLEAAIELLLGLVEGAMEVLPDLIEAALEIITTLVTTLLEQLPELIEMGIELILALLDGLIDALPMILSFIADDLIPMLIDTVVDLLPRIIDAGVDLIVALLEGLLEALPMIIQFVIVDLIPQLVVAIIKNLPKLLEAGVQILGSLLDGFGRALPRLLGFFLKLPGEIFDALPDPGRILLDAGQAIMGGLLDGLRAAWDGVAGWLGGVGDSIRSLKGPLVEDKRLLVPAGELILQGLQAGMDNEMRALAATLGGITAQITATPAQAELAANSGPGDMDVRVFLGDRELKDLVRVEINGVHREIKSRVRAGAGAVR